MSYFKVGDEIYIVEVSLRRCKIIKNLVTDSLDLWPVENEIDVARERVIAPKKQAIHAMIARLQELKDD